MAPQRPAASQRSIIGPTNDHANRNSRIARLRCFIRARIGREPKIFAHLLPVGLKYCEWERRRCHVAKLGNPLADRFYDHQVLLVHPYHAGKIGMRSVECVRRYGKKIRAQLIKRLLSLEAYLRSVEAAKSSEQTSASQRRYRNPRVEGPDSEAWRRSAAPAFHRACRPL